MSSTGMGGVVCAAVSPMSFIALGMPWEAAAGLVVLLVWMTVAVEKIRAERDVTVALLGGESRRSE